MVNLQRLQRLRKAAMDGMAAGEEGQYRKILEIADEIIAKRGFWKRRRDRP